MSCPTNNNKLLLLFLPPPPLGALLQQPMTISFWTAPLFHLYIRDRLYCLRFSFHYIQNFQPSVSEIRVTLLRLLSKYFSPSPSLPP